MKVNESVPLKLAFGVYVTAEPLKVAVPFETSVTSVNVRASPSTSEAPKVIVTLVSSSVLTAWSEAIGTSFTAVTVIDTVEILLSTVPSFAL